MRRSAAPPPLKRARTKTHVEAEEEEEQVEQATQAKQAEQAEQATQAQVSEKRANSAARMKALVDKVQALCDVLARTTGTTRNVAEQVACMRGKPCYAAVPRAKVRVIQAAASFKTAMRDALRSHDALDYVDEEDDAAERVTRVKLVPPEDGTIAAYTERMGAVRAEFDAACAVIDAELAAAQATLSAVRDARLFLDAATTALADTLNVLADDDFDATAITFDEMSAFEEAQKCLRTRREEQAGELRRLLSVAHAQLGAPQTDEE